MRIARTPSTLCIGQAILCGFIGFLAGCNSESPSSAAKIETADMAVAEEQTLEKIVLGGGCFWCVEAVFEEVDGVVSTVSGYAGGETEDPTYRQVCAGTTGHAEVCELQYDPSAISLEIILDAFFETHDPTTLNRQGVDRGTQYRSTILYTSEEQRIAAQAYLAQLDSSGLHASPIVTTVEPLATFYPAEEEHQDYYRKNPTAGYCVRNIPTKLKKLRALLARKSEEKPMSTNEPQDETPVPENTSNMKVITLGGGCFWCVEAVFEEMAGVTAAVSGYAGGHVENPSYNAVCSDTTGHAEVCEIHYDGSKVGLDELLDVFFKTHDPTTLNQQGHDRGSQYRSTIMYHDDAQREFAKQYINKLDESGRLANKVVTEIVAAPKFYEAEEYHQDYFRKNPGAGYCIAVVAPKVKKFRDVFPDKRKSANDE